MGIDKVISGGQTGADQAGLWAARDVGIKTGGHAPKYYRTDNGPQPKLKEWFGLVEDASYGYPPRTRLNVIYSDGTVIFGNTNSPGCRLTIQLCTNNNRPYICNPESVEEFLEWVEEHDIKTLNVAGNRERTNPGIFDKVRVFLVSALKAGK